jgi:hypothetical protein
MKPLYFIPAQTFRGYWLTETGQLVCQWIPQGHYDLGPVTEVNGQRIAAAVGENGRAYHVSESTAARIAEV